MLALIPLVNGVGQDKVVQQRGDLGDVNVVNAH